MLKLFGKAHKKEKEKDSVSVIPVENQTSFDKHPLDYALTNAYMVVKELAEDVFLTT